MSDIDSAQTITKVLVTFVSNSFTLSRPYVNDLHWPSKHLQCFLFRHVPVKDPIYPV
jgi:hypothetical protein